MSQIPLDIDVFGYPELSAVVNDDVAALTALAPTPQIINAASHPTGHTPLSLALQLARSLAFIQCLIALGADVNADVLDTRAICHVAARHVADSRVVAALIAAGCDFAKLDSADDSSACHYAAMNPAVSVLTALVDAGLPCDLPNRFGQRPIHFAVLNPHGDVVLRTLVARGCAVADEDRPVWCHLAARNANDGVISALIAAGAAVGAPNIDNDTPLHWAAHNENDRVVAALIAARVPLNETGAWPYCRTPAFLACSNPNPRVLERLLEAGAVLGTMEADGATPCHEAAKNRDVAVMTLLIARGLDVNARDGDQITPLHQAALAGTVAMVTLLLASGAEIAAVDRSQETVCHCAARNVRDGMMRALVAAGADFRSPSVTGQTPMQIAIESDNRFAIGALIDAGVSVVDALGAAERHAEMLRKSASTPDAAALRLLVRSGVDVRCADENGQTVCHWASSRGMAIAIALGADVNALDNDGRAAIFLSEGDRCLTLIAAGADLEARDESGTSAADRIRRDGSVSDVATVAAVLGAPAAPDQSPPPLDARLLAWARHRLAARQFELLRLRAFEICVGLHSRNLTALELCEILAHAFAPRQLLVPWHRVWALATTIKHFQATTYHSK